MSATTAGAIKAHLETAGLGVSVYRDRAPKDQPLPFVVVHEGIAETMDRHGDTQDPAGHRGVTEEVQVSLFQEWRRPDGRTGERPGLVSDVVRHLHGATLATAPTRVYGVLVASRVRMAPAAAPTPTGAAADDNVVHDAITVRIRRDL